MSESKKALLQWVVARGGLIHPDLDFMADLGGGERGVVAVKAIPESEQLAVLPMCLCLHTPISSGGTPQVPRLVLSCFLVTTFMCHWRGFSRFLQQREGSLLPTGAQRMCNISCKQTTASAAFHCYSPDAHARACKGVPPCQVAYTSYGTVALL